MKSPGQSEGKGRPLPARGASKTQTGFLPGLIRAAAPVFLSAFLLGFFAAADGLDDTRSQDRASGKTESGASRRNLSPPAQAGILPPPELVSLPKGIKKMSAGEIRAVFAPLKKQHAASPSTIWSLTYREALLLKKKDSKAFCEGMKLLASMERFPLHQLALIQSFEICPYSEGLKLEPSDFPPWLQVRAAEAFYKRKARFRSPMQTFEAAKFLGLQSPYKEIRASYLKHALFIAGREGYGAEDIKERLFREAPRLRPRPGPADYLAVADDFRKNRSFSQAIRFYRKILRGGQFSFAEKDQAFRRLAWIYRVRGNRRGSARARRQRASWLLRENSAESLSRYYSVRLKEARSLWNASANKKALALVSQILQDPKAGAARARALYLRALVREEEGRHAASLQDLKELTALLDSQKDPALLEKALWKKAWLLRLQRRERPSLAALKKLEAHSKNPYIKYRVWFWRGETYREMGYQFRARRFFQKLKAEDLFGYYGLMARRRLREGMSIKAGPQRSFSEGLAGGFSGQSLIDKKAESLVYWLSFFRESELLGRFLETREKFFAQSGKKTAAGWQSLFSLWTGAGRHLKVFQSLEQLDAAAKRHFFERGLAYLFPFGFEREVLAAAKKNSLDPAMIFALIRQESAFQTRARSLADAFGLMQMIPSTAKLTARRLKIPYRGFRDLYNPSKSITLGTAHLKRLLKRYEGSFILAMAAYNAGGVPVSKWRRRLPASNPLEFIESIPYSETRNYVRLLIRNYLFYHNMLKSRSEEKSLARGSRRQVMRRGKNWFPDQILSIAPPAELQPVELQPVEKPGKKTSLLTAP